MSEEIGARVAGTQEDVKASQYVASTFRSFGYSPEVQVVPHLVPLSNVTAVKEGVSEDTIIVGAHFDSGHEGGSKGADDNASSVAVMLEVARMLKDVETPYTVWFIAFLGHVSGGFRGSYYCANHLTKAERAKTIVYVNLNGLIADDSAYVYGGYGEGGKIRDWLLG